MAGEPGGVLLPNNMAEGEKEREGSRGATLDREGLGGSTLHAGARLLAAAATGPLLPPRATKDLDTVAEISYRHSACFPSYASSRDDSEGDSRSPSPLPGSPPRHTDSGSLTDSAAEPGAVGAGVRLHAAWGVPCAGLPPRGGTGCSCGPSLLLLPRLCAAGGLGGGASGLGPGAIELNPGLLHPARQLEAAARAVWPPVPTLAPPTSPMLTSPTGEWVAKGGMLVGWALQGPWLWPRRGQGPPGGSGAMQGLRRAEWQPSGGLACKGRRIWCLPVSLPACLRACRLVAAVPPCLAGRSRARTAQPPHAAST
jgi:hypothetical protein